MGREGNRYVQPKSWQVQPRGCVGFQVPKVSTAFFGHSRHGMSRFQVRPTWMDPSLKKASSGVGQHGNDEVEPPWLLAQLSCCLQ